MNLLTVLLLSQGQGQGGGSQMWIMLIAMAVVFYFFMIRPQQKKAKELKKFRESLKKGDRVVTIGGIHGKISEIRDTTLIIEVEGGSKLKIERDAISADRREAASTATETEKN